MEDEVFDRILEGARQAADFASGKDTSKVRTYEVAVPDQIDAKAVRTKTGLTQREFARAFGVNVETLRNWEQGKRAPKGPARALLTIVEKRPEVFQEVFSQSATLS